ncbi:extracellular catalytic domain type 1 short-chain-length polyhydroxyalkanoate depolymerase [Mangrovicoccus algicola]|uniref:PHB depolymerase family esterase n=1 Tax=Mangrovicoccus algicola TaxID=2771008 RepID=A0A8J7CYX8_9RHOB|nr:PHB depolymerase family esterase [Mangrovicoccus algicola]MBE3637093.1 PHB depolymerase family esterase [Mangrovicoccus algicola]
MPASPPVAAILFGLAAAFGTALPGTAGTLVRDTLPAAAHPESRDRDYALYLPDGLPADGSAALVTVLHGCKQTQDDMLEQTGFRALADVEGFAVLYPFITSYDGRRSENCWGFWIDHHRHEGAGEPADLRRLIAAAETRAGTDPARRYVAGLSSGAAMSVVMAVAWSEDIAAAGAVAGLGYAEDAWAVRTLPGCSWPVWTDTPEEMVEEMRAEQDAPGEDRLVPLMVMHSLNDCRVPVQNGQALAASWIRRYDALPDPVSQSDCSDDAIPCLQSRFEDAQGREVLETVFFEGPDISGTHYWPGDGTGDYARPEGPPAAQLLWAFFRDKRLDPAP